MPDEPEHTAPVAEPTDEPRKQVRKRKGGPRERSGCLTCRNRKKKCDGATPVCEQCRRLNYSCLREEPRSHIPANAHAWKTPPRALVHTTAGSSASDSPPLYDAPDVSGTHMSSTVSNELATHRKEVMRYYIQTFATILTTNMENNCFLSVFLPMAMDSPTLHNAILAWSSSHMSLHDPKYRRTALQFRGISLSSLQTTLSSRVGMPDLETSLACCLVLCSMEIILGDTAQWFQHLAGAFQVVRSASAVEVGQDKLPLVPTGFLASADGRWLLRNFAFHDIMMSVTCDRRPFLPGFYWASQDESIPDSYFGLASRLIYLVSEISMLNSDMSESSSIDSRRLETVFDSEQYILADGLSDTTKAYSNRAHELENQLLEWQCAPSHNPSLVGLAEAYRAAALIHLYRTLRRHLRKLTPTLDYKIAQVVQTMIECLETMPQGCMPESTLLFPLFMAGGEAKKPEHWHIIRQRLVIIYETRHFRNVSIALEVLDEIWASRTSVVGSGEPIQKDWSDVLKRKGWKLALT